MRFAVLCVALCCLAPRAAAQVSFVRADAADEQVAAALRQLIADDVVLVAASQSALDASAAQVSIDRKRAILHVVSRANPAGASRTLDGKLLASSPYAVALAAAELLDLLNVDARQPAHAATQTAAVDPHGSAPTTDRRVPDAGGAAPSVAVGLAVRTTTSDSREAADPALPAAAGETVAQELKEPEPTPIVLATPDASSHAPHDTLLSSGVPPHIGRRAPLGFAIEADVELQTQPTESLSFVRPAAYAELAWNRNRPGLFFAAGVRASAPLSTTLHPSAAGVAQGSSLNARATDAAVQGSLGYSLGRLALAGHVAAGMTYLRVEAFGTERQMLGQDTQVSPLLAAGIGARVPLALGFALAVRSEAQWAGAPARYRIGGEKVLDGSPFRLTLLAGALWESAFGGGS